MAPYFISSLIPRREPTKERNRSFFEAVKSITFVQWGFFFTGWLAWTCDATDFFSVALTVPLLQHQFGKSSAAPIITAITLTLLFRSFGALIFGLFADRYGRKWPLIVNLLIMAALEVGTGFIQTFPQFLAVRSLFGICMSGIWGLTSATALENLPVETRGIVSGIIQQGYAVGYLLAVLNLYLVPKTSWRCLFWTCSGISSFTATLRVMLPESEAFMRAKREADLINTDSKTKVFLREMKLILKKHWLRCIYAILLMAGFNFMSHASQDLYPTYMQVTKGFSRHESTVATIIGNCGAIAGGVVSGYISQYIGRRLTIVIFVVLAGAFIPLWIIPSTLGALEAGAFCLQVGVQGAWGIIPVYLAEISPSAFRTTFPGLAYQIGNMISAASSQIEATGGNHQQTVLNGKVVPDYAKVQGIFMGVIVAYVLVLTIIGPENHGSHFENARAAFEEGAAEGVEIQDDRPRKEVQDDEHHSYDEKLEQ